MHFRKSLVAIDPHEGQFLYLGRWVDKEHFRAFVYAEDGSERLADSYDEYQSLIESGLWFSVKPDKSTEKPIDKSKDNEISVLASNGRKRKYGSVRTTS